VYVRGYVCAIIGFGRARVTIVIKSYEAGAGWRRAPSLLPVAAPVISRIYPLYARGAYRREGDLDFRGLNATPCPESESLRGYPRGPRGHSQLTGNGQELGMLFLEGGTGTRSLRLDLSSSANRAV